MIFNRVNSLLLLAFVLLNINVYSQSLNRSDVEKEIISLRAKLEIQEKALLSPSPQDRAGFAKFLEQPNTGLIRLLPRGKYEKQITLRGGGAYYSFSELTHEYNNGSDLQLESGVLSSGFAGANFGILTNIGDVPLDSVTAELFGVQFLNDFETPDTEPKARIEQRKFFDKGFVQNELTYKNRAPAVVNETYVLRSINYDASDVLVAFRVVRKNADNSLILAWKLLKTFPKPALLRENLSSATIR